MNQDTGEITEIYNGPGKRPMGLAYLNKKNNTKQIMVSSLKKLSKQVQKEEKIPLLRKIENKV